jgi:hypothetical protein
VTSTGLFDTLVIVHHMETLFRPLSTRWGAVYRVVAARAGEAALTSNITTTAIRTKTRMRTLSLSAASCGLGSGGSIEGASCPVNEAPIAEIAAGRAGLEG